MMFPPNYLHQHSTPPPHTHKPQAKKININTARLRVSCVLFGGREMWGTFSRCGGGVGCIDLGSSGTRKTKQLRFKAHWPSAQRILFSGTTGRNNRDWYDDVGWSALIFHVLTGPNRHPVLFFMLVFSWWRPASFVNWLQEMPWPISRGTCYRFNVS